MQSYKTDVLWDISDTGFHQLLIKVQVRNIRSLIICTVYRPPNIPVNRLDLSLTPAFIIASLMAKPIYILGDLNYNILKPEHSDGKTLLSLCNSYNLCQMVKTSTRVTNSTESLIDVILASNLQQVLETIV